MQVKICGVTTNEALTAAIDASADMIGFVFAPSRRRIEPAHAAGLVKKLPCHIQSVGVFVNESRKNILLMAEEVKLDIIQLHGEEAPDFCRSLPLPVIKAFSVRQDSDLANAAEYDCEYYLFDSPGVTHQGGSGIPFDWNLLGNLAIPREKVILAGGLNEGNVLEAIRRVQPAIIDVSSGVETNGVKDAIKIKKFIQKARGERKRDEHDRIHIT